MVKRGAQLAGLWALAVAQPFFEVVKSAEAFVVAGWRGGDIVVFAVAVAFAAPLVMLAIEAGAARLSPRLAAWLHLAFVTSLVAVLALYVVKHETGLPSAAALAIGVGAAASGGYAFWRFEPARWFVTLVSPASVLVVALFLLGSPVRHLVFPADGADHSGPRPAAPVVMIVLDEFPTLSLLDARGNLDGRSYPAFARLARDGTWFRHATTVADFTKAAVPAILTGRRQDGSKPGSLAAHPDNLLALLGRRGGANVREDTTRLCPAELCPLAAPDPLPGRVTRVLPAFAKLSLATFLPDALYRHLPTTHPFRRAHHVSLEEEFGRFATSVARSRAAINYLHTFSLPHQPWTRLPSGRQYAPFAQDLRDFYPDLPDVPMRTGLPSFPGLRWTGDGLRITHMRQRHLAQVRFADKLVGQTLDQLRASGVYDRALIVVTADHGIAFRGGQDARRVSDANAAEIMHVPLFVKPPGGRRGTVSDRHVQSIDIAPTIASLLGIRLPWRTDGRPADPPAGPDRERVSVESVETGRRFEFDVADLTADLRRAAREQAGLFSGTDPDRIFRAGPHRALVGRPVRELGERPPAALRYSLAGDPRALDVDPASGTVPALITGSLTGPDATDRQLALVLNGRVAATTVSRRSRGAVRFEALMAERFVRAGPNALSLHLITSGGGKPALSEIKAAG